MWRKWLQWAIGVFGVFDLLLCFRLATTLSAWVFGAMFVVGVWCLYGSAAMSDRPHGW